MAVRRRAGQRVQAPRRHSLQRACTYKEGAATMHVALQGANSHQATCIKQGSEQAAVKHAP